AASAVLTMWIAGAATQTVASDWSEPSLPVVTKPVLSTTPLSLQSPPVVLSVVETMCTVKVEFAWVVPAGTVTGPQSSSLPLILQVEFQPDPWSLICQDRPGLVGSGSVRFTVCASPSPEFQTVSVKPICSPALTCAASAVFLMWIAAPLTVTGSSA